MLAAGFRVLGSRRGIDASATHVRSILRRLGAQEITAEQAIREASSTGRHSDVIPQLQANFAFTKSYLAERSGSDGNLPGSNFFVDLALFDDPVPSWIQRGPTINWSDPDLNLSGQFAQVHALSEPANVNGQAGVLDGLAVANALAPSDDVLAALQSMRRD